MISKDDIAKIVEDYDRMKLRIGMTASHSALDICDGAIEEGFLPWLIVKKGGTKPMLIISKPIEPIQAELSEVWLIKPLSCHHSMM